MRVRALKKFEGLLDLERSAAENRDVYPKEGDEWEVSAERADILKSHGVVEIVEDKKENKKKEVEEEKPEEIITEEIITEPITEIKKTTKKKKTSKK